LVAVVTLAVLVTLSVIVVRGFLTPSLDTHHTVSITERLVRRGPDPANPVWVIATLRREIWIQRNGAGRIQEQYEPIAFPTESERQQAETLRDPLPEFSGLNETFRPGGLTYVSEGDILARIDQLRTAELDPSELMDMFGSYLTETVPTPEAVNAAIELATTIDGVKVERSTATTTVSATIGTRTTTFTFHAVTARLQSQQQTENSTLAGLDLTPPIVLFRQDFVQAEDIAS
jgi:hypothetical protein